VANFPLAATDIAGLPLPPTSGPYPPEPPTSPAPSPAPAAPPDELTTLREKVAEQAHVISLAKTRVETLLAQGSEAVARARRLEEQLEAAGRREAELLERIASLESPSATSFDHKTIAELLDRVAALEAIAARTPPA
jgi:hypothetical protein